MGDLLDAVATSLAALALGPEFEGAAELARHLALEIDVAEIAEAVADRAIQRAQDQNEEPELVEMIRALKAKVGRRDAIVRCGQRLESLLGELGATPKARGSAGGSVGGSVGGPLALLRGGAG